MKKSKPVPGCEGWTKKKKYVKAHARMTRFKKAYRTDPCNARFRKKRGAVFAEAAVIGRQKFVKARLIARMNKKSKK